MNSKNSNKRLALPFTISIMLVGLAFFIHDQQTRRDVPLTSSGEQILNEESITSNLAETVAQTEVPGVVDVIQIIESGDTIEVTDEIVAQFRVRRERMRQLIVKHPEAALQQALSPAQIAVLPEELQALTEKHVVGVGLYSLAVLCTHSEEEIGSKGHAMWEHEYHRSVEVNDRMYHAHVFGERVEKGTAEEPIYGVAIGEDIALAETSTYLGKKQDGTWLVALNGELSTFETEADAQEFKTTQLAALNVLPGEVFTPILPPSTSTPPTEVYDEYTGTFRHQKGPKTVMFIYGNVVGYTQHADVHRKSDATLLNELQGTSQRYYDVSYRQTWFGPKEMSNGDIIPMLHVTPTIQLPQTQAYYKESLNRFGSLRSDALAAVRALGGEYNGGRLDPSNFDRIVFWSTDKLISSTGLAYVGGQFSWSGNTLSGGIVLHEFGHNWGLHHPGNVLTAEAGIPRDIGNSYSSGGGIGSLMGRGVNGMFSIKEREALGFLEVVEGEISEVTSSGTYRVFDYQDIESKNATSRVRGLKIPIEGFNFSLKHIALGFRHETGETDPDSYEVWTRNALEALAWRSSSNSSANNAFQYLDTTPFSYSAEDGDEKSDLRDGAIPLGRTYSEGPNVNGRQIYGGFHITPFARGSITVDGHTHEYIDVAVHYGKDIVDNTPPEITTLWASEVTVGIGEIVNFSVTATDDDGDPLYYWWKFHGSDHHRSQDNFATQSHSWNQAGEYWVSAVVSDGKGGTATKGIRVTVDNPGGVYDIRGRVLAGGQPVVGAKIRISSPGPADEEKFIDTFSQSDGTYVLPNLSPGTYTVNITHQRYSNPFTPTGRTVVIGSTSLFGIDFEYPVLPEIGYNISGKVNFYFNAPIGGAVVSCAGQQTLSAADGSYTLRNIPEGDHIVTASHPDYELDPREVFVDANKTGIDVFSQANAMYIYAPDVGPNGIPDQQGLIYIEGYPVLNYPSVGSFTWDAGTQVRGFTWMPREKEVNVRVLIPGYTATPATFTNPFLASGTNSSYFEDVNLVSEFSSDVLVQGYVYSSSGHPLSGVTMSDGTVSSTTNGSGYYQLLVGGTSGTVVITPSKAGLSFSPASRSVTLAGNPSDVGNFVLSGGDNPPTLATSATATLTGGATINLSVLGNDDNGEANLTYSWEKMSGVGVVEFLTNYTNDSKNTVATVKAAGTYHFRVTVRDEMGNEVQSTTGSVTVVPEPTAIVVSPGYTEVGLNSPYAFTAKGFDQFGDSLTVSPSWSVSAGGSIDSAGTFTPTTLGSGYVVTATQGSVTGSGIFSVVPAKPTVTLTQMEPIVFSPGTFTLAADASDPDGTVAKVEFFLNGSKVGEDTTVPYSLDLLDYPQGQYDFHAVATDNDGYTTATVPYRFWISTPITGIVKVNMERIAFTTPSGFLPEKGETLGIRPSGFHYGWDSDFQSRDGNADDGMIEWSGGFDPEDRSAMKGWSGNQTYTWRMRVPNGRYTVQVRVGDPTQGSNVPTYRIINGVEISGNVGAPGNEFITLSREVDVTSNQITVTDFRPGKEAGNTRTGTSHIVIIPDVPVVAVSASGDGDEHTPSPIDFTVERLANPGESFTLNFRLGGTAQASDYSVSGATSYNTGTGTGTLNFGVGEISKVITVTPAQDSEVEGTETVQITIENGETYSATTSTASAGIRDAQTDYPPIAQLRWPVLGSSVSLDISGTHWVEVTGTDDGFGDSTLTYNWVQLSGPGTVTFTDQTAPGTRVSVDAAGSYVIQATISDGSHNTTVDVHVDVGQGLSPTNGLLAHYALDEPAGAGAAADSSGNGHTATVVGDSTFGEEDARSQVSLFDGSGDRLESTTAATPLGGGSALSVSLWYNADSSPSDRGMIEIRSPDDSTEVFFIRFDDAGWSVINGSSDNHLQLLLKTTEEGNTRNLTLYSSNDLQSANEWVHVVYVWESGKLPKLYIDSVENVPTANGYYDGSNWNNGSISSGTINTTGKLVMGRGWNHDWDGALDDIRIYNRALDASEVAALFAGAPSNTVPVVSVTADTTVPVNTDLHLDGTVRDAESIPNVTWRQLSGPGIASFGNAGAENSTVRFDTAGSYEIALVGDDGEMADGEMLSVIVTGSSRAYDQNYVDSLYASHPLGITGPHTDFDAVTNGVLANGIIYAFVIDSLDPAEAGGKLPVSAIVDDHLQISFRRIKGGTGHAEKTYSAGGITYTVECSSTLVPNSWQSGSAVLEQVGNAVDNDDGTETVVVRVKATVTSDTDGKEFIRIRVTLP